jgi:hypothetical protein
MGGHCEALDDNSFRGRHVREFIFVRDLRNRHPSDGVPADIAEGVFVKKGPPFPVINQAIRNSEQSARALSLDQEIDKDVPI